MGLIISVYRNAEFGGDATAGGVSSKFNRLTVVNAEGPFEPRDDAPAVLLAKNHGGTVKIVPAIPTLGGYQVLQQSGAAGPMFGGNYATTSDSRFREAVEDILGTRFYGAVAVHDRYETAEMQGQ